MRDWEQLIVEATSSILDAVAILDRNTHKIVLVADAARKLAGTVTDGDVRRAILRGADLTAPVETIMRQDCKSMELGSPPDRIYSELLQSDIRHMPIVQDDGILVGLCSIEEVQAATSLDNAVVIMAGGLGTRLRPYTDELPKPMVNVGGRPMLETILELYKQFGFHRFYLSVNYRSEVIRTHFGDGSRFGVNIHYLEEKKKLGTAGSLSLLPNDALTHPLVVTNGDVLTQVNLRALLGFHAEQQNTVTVCAREHHVDLPYGVLEIDADRIKRVVEKPRYRHLISAGITVLNPDTIEAIPSNTVLDMPDLINALLCEGHTVKPYIIREYWLDVGKPADLERANLDIEKIVSSSPGQAPFPEHCAPPTQVMVPGMKII